MPGPKIPNGSHKQYTELYDLPNLPDKPGKVLLTFQLFFEIDAINAPRSQPLETKSAGFTVLSVYSWVSPTRSDTNVAKYEGCHKSYQNLAK